MKDNRLLYPKNKIDWGPGENHICLRAQNKNYYVIELFHQAPTFDRTIPLFISDINSSPNLYGIYNYIADNLRHVVLVNNYPINQINVFGKIIRQQYKEKMYNGAEDAYVVLVVSDFVGTDCKIRVRIPLDMFTALGLTIEKNNYGKIVEIEGGIHNWCDACNHDKQPDREIRAEKITVLSHDPAGLHCEMEQWRKRMEFRKENLVEPWVFIPTPQRENQTIEYTFTESDLKKKQQRQELVLSSPRELDDVLPVEEDSLVVHAMHKSSESIRGPPTPTSDDQLASSRRGRDDTLTPSNNEPAPYDFISMDETPLRAVTEFQVMSEIVRFIIEKRFVKIKLRDAYRDPHISELLKHLTNLQISSLQSTPKFQNLSFEEYKSIIFHRLRRNLQKNYQLISVSKSQLVRLKNLQNLYTSLLNILKTFQRSRTRTPFKIMNYLDVLKIKKLLPGDINYKLINFIIEHILASVLGDKDNWHYDTRSVAWNYIGG
ncbi:hypothetical protein Cantr_02719 [Candida viswanathii]|uniref:CST complex subunit Stn1 N-terminal domain-containing protein n=1 Tax=Candida viswanathii TaxID=5486 RepID=A0A367YND3_9ASCO|nr:hypothetical protein Cantr_02719 [Candida viswanathii]